MSLLTRAHVASLSVLLLAGSLLAVASAPSVAADVTTNVDRSAEMTFLDGNAWFDSPGGEAITVPAAGTASPYPSQVVVDQQGLVLDLDLYLAFSHERPDDLDIMLVGPQGQAVVVMSDAAGTQGQTADPTLDDEATDFLPDEDPIDFINGEHQPRNYGDGPDTFPASAPAPTTSSPLLGAFDGSNAAGTWRLFVVDDSGEASGQVTHWRLEFDLAAPGAYPSELQVSGIGLVTDLDVSIRGFDTEYGRDMTFILVGPRGQHTMLMNDVGGGASEAVTGVNLRFDDEAPYLVSEFKKLESTSYQPTDAEPGAHHPPPVPQVPAGQARPTSLGVFDGTDPNGTWRLFGYDRNGGDVSAMDGWSLHIRWADNASPSGTARIEDGATRTASRTVQVSITAADLAPGTGITQMRLSNDGASYGPWTTYSPTTSWLLTKRNGVTSVYVQLRDGVGNVSEVLRDTILLDTKPPRSKRTSPQESSRRVAPGAKLKVWASERLEPSTLTAATVRLTRAGDPVAATVTYVPEKRRVVVEAKQSLAPGSYRLKVTTKVTDLAGNRWDQRSASGRQPLVVDFRVPG